MGEKQEKNVKKNEGDKKSESVVNTITLQFDMHCEGCAKKVRKSIKKLEGVENVTTDCSTSKLVVTGKVDPVKVKEIVEEKMKKKVELVSLQPNKPAKDGGNGDGMVKKSDDKKPEEKKSEGKSDDKKKSEGKSDDKKNSNGKSNDKKKSEDNEKKEKQKEPLVSTVQLKTKVHCEGCAQKIKKIVSKCEGVQDVNVDLQKDLITTKGTMNMKELLPYLNIKLKRAVELAPTKKDEGTGGDKKPKEGGKGSEKQKEGSNGNSEKPKESGEGEKKEGSEEKKDGGSDKKKGGNNGGDSGASNANGTRIEISKMEYNPYGYDNGYSLYTYDTRQGGGEGSYGHQVVEYWHGQEYSQPPQLFSDENPNACSIM